MAEAEAPACSRLPSSGPTDGCATTEATTTEAAKAAAFRKSSVRRIGFIRFAASLSQPAKGGKQCTVPKFDFKIFAVLNFFLDTPSRVAKMSIPALLDFNAGMLFFSALVRIKSLHQIAASNR